MSPWSAITRLRGIGVALIRRREACRRLPHQGQALGDAEAVLLVDDGERQIGEPDVGAQQRVRAHGHGHPALGQGGEQLGSRPRIATDDEADLEAQRRCPGAQRLMVLARQELGRRHQHGLAPCLHRGQHRHEGDQRLARAHVALQEADTRARIREIGLDLGKRRRLIGGRRERQTRQQRALQPAVAHRGTAGGGRAVAPHEAERQMHRQQLVERQPAPTVGCGDLGACAMQRLDGVGEARELHGERRGAALPLGSSGSRSSAAPTSRRRRP